MEEERLLGNEHLKEYLKTACSSGKFSHAYMICGPESSGKSTFAKMLCKAILCRGAARPCGRCSDCRKVEKGIHPDLRTVERTADKKSILVDQIREIAADIAVIPNEADRKVYVIRDAETMNIQAQNAMLKFLEEPPEYAVVILCATEPEALLETIRSRCVVLKMAPLTEQELYGALKARFPDKPEEELRQAALSGFMGEAEERLTAAETDAERLTAAVLRGDRLDVLRRSLALESLSKENIPVFLDDLCSAGARAAARSEGRRRDMALRLAELAEQLRRMHDFHVSPGQLSGMLAVQCDSILK